MNAAPNPGGRMQQAVDLVGHLVWPVTLLVVFFLLRRQFRMAFASLIQKRLLTPEELRSVEQVLDSFMQGADASLRARVEGTRSLARAYADPAAP
jgi:hypothetical protein